MLSPRKTRIFSAKVSISARGISREWNPSSAEPSTECNNKATLEDFHRAALCRELRPIEHARKTPAPATTVIGKITQGHFTWIYVSFWYATPLEMVLLGPVRMCSVMPRAMFSVIRDKFPLDKTSGTTPSSLPVGYINSALKICLKAGRFLLYLHHAL